METVSNSRTKLASWTILSLFTYSLFNLPVYLAPLGIGFFGLLSPFSIWNAATLMFAPGLLFTLNIWLIPILAYQAAGLLLPAFLLRTGFYSGNRRFRLITSVALVSSEISRKVGDRLSRAYATGASEFRSVAGSVIMTPSA